MPWGIVGAVAAPVVGGLVSSAVGGSSGGGQKGTQQAEQVADPFASQRPQYQAMLQQLMTPNSNYYQTSPAYNFEMQQGTQAIQRAMAAQGMAGSGNEWEELDQFSQGLAAQDFQQQFNRLAQLSGADINGTGEAGQIAEGGVQQADLGAGVIGNAVGSGISQLGNYLSGGSNVASYNGSPDLSASFGNYGSDFSPSFSYNFSG